MRYHSSGLIEGKIGKTAFIFAEVLAEDATKEGVSEHYTDLFRGTFFVADLHKTLDWDTLVYPDAVKYFSRLLLGKMSREKQFYDKNYQRVKLEDVEFERYFEVYGTDQTESRYILSPSLMARIVDFKNRTKKNIQFSFNNSKVYFAIHYSVKQRLFTPPLLDSVYNLGYLESYVTDIELMLDIVKELNLNSTLDPAGKKAIV